MGATTNNESSKKNHHLRTDSNWGHWGWKHLCVFFCGSFMGFYLYCICYAFVCICLYVLCGHLLGKGWPLGSRFVVSNCGLVTFPLVSRVRCGTWLYRFLIFTPLLWSTSELRVSLAPWNWFKPSSKIFYWPFQGGFSFVDHLCYFALCLSCFRVCLLLPCGHLLGMGWHFGSCLWCSIERGSDKRVLRAVLQFLCNQNFKNV